MGDCPSCAELNCPVMKHLSTVIQDLEKRLDTQIASDQRALQLAEKNIGVRLDNLNHWRAETLSESRVISHTSAFPLKSKRMASSKPSQIKLIVVATADRALHRFYQRLG